METTPLEFVNHSVYGVGHVIVRDGDKTTVSFNAVGVKTINTQFVDLTPCDPPMYTPKPKLPQASFVEWVDPVTGKAHKCPEHYVEALKKHVGQGELNAVLASDILELMGEPVKDSNKRHIRAAALYLKRNGVPCIALRSGEGGYFIAQSVAEIQTYAAQQHKLADSMKQEADALLAAFVTS